MYMYADAPPKNCRPVLVLGPFTTKKSNSYRSVSNRLVQRYRGVPWYFPTMMPDQLLLFYPGVGRYRGLIFGG